MQTAMYDHAIKLSKTELMDEILRLSEENEGLQKDNRILRDEITKLTGKLLYFMKMFHIYKA